MKEVKKSMAFVKKQILTYVGFRTSFKLRLLDLDLKVDYSLRKCKPDRDYLAILNLLEGSTCFYDVGANHGIISLLAAKKYKNIDIHSFEASESAINIINQNIGLNNFNDKIKAINTLVADKSGYTIPFYWQESSGGASITKGRLGHVIEIYKSTLSLDDYTSSNNLFPDFIKMDIEGAENIAIFGMSQILRDNRPSIFIELHDFGSKKLFENAADILKQVKLFNYMMIYLRNGEPILDTIDLADRGRCHVLLMPEEKYVKKDKNYFKFEGL